MVKKGHSHQGLNREVKNVQEDEGVLRDQIVVDQDPCGQ